MNARGGRFVKQFLKRGICLAVLLWSLLLIPLPQASLFAVPPVGGDCDPADYSAPSGLPAEDYAISPGGVDMRGGMYKYSNTDLSIGSPDGGLELVRTLESGDVNRTPDQRFGRFFSHNWDIRLILERIQVCEANTPAEYDFLLSVRHGELGSSFRSLYYTPLDFRQVSNNRRASLSCTGSPGICTLVGHDGTEIVFQSFPGPYHRRVYASAIIAPDGTKYALEYDEPLPGEVRLRSVVSNRGYALLFEYHPPVDDFNLVSKACAINLAERAKPANNVCPLGVPTATYTYDGSESLTSATDAGGDIHRISTAGNALALYRPGENFPFVTNSLEYLDGEYHVTSQQFADGSSYNYSWDMIGYPSGHAKIAGGRFINAQGKQVTVDFGTYHTPFAVDPSQPLLVTPGPETVIDELGRITSYDYCSIPSGGECVVTRLLSATDPEGGKRHYQYDGYRNVTSVRYEPKPGSALADRIETKTYDCSYRVSCAKPVTVTDFRGNTTNYSYDPVHGAMLTATLPADANNIRSQTRYTYAQRYAWVRSGSGYVRAASPVWVLASEEFCRTTAAIGAGCAGGAADEVVTTYEYETGGAAQGSNILLLGVAITADGETLRTCYGYDGWGRRISETQPKAGLASCS